MEIKSPIKPGEITGLQIWPAEHFNKLALTGGFKKDRLGPWHKEMFERAVPGEDTRADIPVFLFPPYKKLAARKSVPGKELRLGVVCWRALLSRYVDEEEFIKEEKNKMENGNSLRHMFSKQTEVGSFQEHVACYANVDDIYKIILSNLNPSDWTKIELNKAERVATNIGDFSMLYHSNAKWFHFVPSYNGTTAGMYKEELNLLLKKGHTVDIGKFQSSSPECDDMGLIGAWSLDNFKDGVAVGQDLFSSLVEKDIRAFLSLKRKRSVHHRRTQSGDVDMTGNGLQNGTPAPTNVFFGGVTTKETEYEVSRVLANVIHNAIWCVGKKLLRPKETDVGYQKPLQEVLGGRNYPEDLLEGVQVDLLTVKTFEEVRAMAAVATKILSHLLTDVNVSGTCDSNDLKLGLACSRAFGMLSANLGVLGWDAENLNGLCQKAWLAGTVNTIGDERTGAQSHVLPSNALPELDPDIYPRS